MRDYVALGSNSCMLWIFSSDILMLGTHGMSIGIELYDWERSKGEV